MNRILIFLSLFSGLAILLPSCEKNNDDRTVSDQDGNIYHTVTIGTQTWMSDNLKAIHYNDGTPINNIKDNTEWSIAVSGAYCWQSNDTLNREPYGALYNWFAVQTGKLCPAGWHIPSDDEWTALTEYLGGADTAASQLKETGFTHWMYPNMGATNSSGYSALPGGYRNNAGSYKRTFTVNGEVMGNFGYWWTSTEADTYKSLARNMYSDIYRVGELSADKKYGLSIRCLRDN